ncbi:hypothetical protein QBZ16_001423 [Prototheca wickerhamii]|uniref:Uncharacterized protein n=1 Tax=Prototheca wickerhamii TaxID=3111 RepID=A0AAD9IH02_PROWI|nr:hypothetical protein QBZ16_001423 [Prototheca wickerhamii]
MVRQVIRVPVAAEGSRHAPPRIPTQRHPTDLVPVSHVHYPHGGSGRSSLASLGLHRVPSLLFEMDLGGEGAEAPLRPVDEGGLAVSLAKIAELLSPASETEYMVLLHVRFACEDAERRGRALSFSTLAETLRRRGGELIVDPAFREQFEIAHVPERYDRVIERVPQAVVLPRARLEALAGVLCAEMGHAFAEMGLSQPPWRGLGAILSKWRPGGGAGRGRGSAELAADLARRVLALRTDDDERAPGVEALSPEFDLDVFGAALEGSSGAAATRAALDLAAPRTGQSTLGSSPVAVAVTPCSLSDEDEELGPAARARAADVFYNAERVAAAGLSAGGSSFGSLVRAN